MERRVAKVSFRPASKAADVGKATCTVTIPSSWVSALGMTRDDRQVILTLDDDMICISRHLSMNKFAEQAKAAQHELVTLKFFDAEILCSTILADFTAKDLLVENHTDNLVKTAFGVHLYPSWEDFLDFLEERCIPRERAGLREYLEAIGVAEYDPYQIILKTQGRMAEDQQWLEVTAL